MAVKVVGTRFAEHTFVLLAFVLLGRATLTANVRPMSLCNGSLCVAVKPQDGSYQIHARGLRHSVLTSRVGAEVNWHWLHSNDYPLHKLAESRFKNELGSGRQVTVINTGLAGQPNLLYTLRLYNTPPYGEIEVRLNNRTGRSVTVQAFRAVESMGRTQIDLGGPDRADRILSDTFSDYNPTWRIAYDLGKREVHRGVGSQLIYNRLSGWSLFWGALTSQHFISVFCLRVKHFSAGIKIASYTVDLTGTTEIERGGPLRIATADQIELSLLVPTGQDLNGERLMFQIGNDYHEQLEAYGNAIRQLYHARVDGPNLMGWWSWTAYGNKLSEGEALANARWLARHLKGLGYDYFHVDDGYQYALGDYTKPNVTLFPSGCAQFGRELQQLGLKFGLWTAPFEVAKQSWVYRHHREWLVKNAQREPIRVEWGNKRIPIYVLDTTNPGVQAYLRQTYQTLARKWGVRYIKLDFMDTTAIEGYRYRPNTTALEAQRIGLEVIREAVGQNVLLDKDGSPMLNVVGIVDEGRISSDRIHSFRASKNAALGIAARYYMDRNFFVSDPDAFSVTRQLVTSRVWGHSATPLTQDEAEVSITLSALAGGMYEIGDDMPALESEPDRMALIENRDLLKIVALKRAAKPLDLMTYRSEDEQPSIFWLREDKRQGMLAVFNWTERPRSHTFRLADLHLPVTHIYQAYDVFSHDLPLPLVRDEIRLANQPPHSVRLIKLVDTSVPAVP